MKVPADLKQLKTIGPNPQYAASSRAAVLGVSGHVRICPNGHMVGEDYPECSLCKYPERQKRYERVTVICEYCGEEKTVPAFQKDSRFCSGKCARAWREENTDSLNPPELQSARRRRTAA